MIVMSCQTEQAAAALKNEIADRAKALGFDSCKIAALARPQHGEEFRAWLRDGAAGEMDWLGRGQEKRCDPDKILPGGRSVIVVALNYFQGDGNRRRDGGHYRTRPDRALCVGRGLP